MSPVLDTSAYIAFVKNHPSVVKCFRQAENLIVPTIVLGELLYGYHKGTRLVENKATLNRFLAQSRVQIAVIDEVVAEQYGRLKQVQDAAGLSVSDNDLWIAAIAAELNLPILTLDSHFDQIQAVELVNLKL